MGLREATRASNKQLTSMALRAMAVGIRITSLFEGAAAAGEKTVLFRARNMRAFRFATR